MFIQANDLKDESILPPNAFYREPRDHSTIHVEPGDTLEKFIKKVSISREEKNYPPLKEEDLRILVVACLEKTTPPSEHPTYFQRKSVNPAFGKVFELTQALVSQINSKAPSFELRQKRAETCLACPMHQGNMQVASFMANTIKKVLDIIQSQESLDQLNASPKEKQLGVCGMCGCGMTNKIRMELYGALSSINPAQLDTFLANLGVEAFDTCWILKESIGSLKCRSVLEAKLKHTHNRGLDLLKANLQAKVIKAKNG